MQKAASIQLCMMSSIDMPQNSESMETQDAALNFNLAITSAIEESFSQKIK